MNIEKTVKNWYLKEKYDSITWWRTLTLLNEQVKWEKEDDKRKNRDDL